jgi:hypothetical protein
MANYSPKRMGQNFNLTTGGDLSNAKVDQEGTTPTPNQTSTESQNTKSRN